MTDREINLAWLRKQRELWKRMPESDRRSEMLAEIYRAIAELEGQEYKGEAPTGE